METIKQQYAQERRNYLRRVNRLTKQGYVVEVIPKVKKPTRASINRLKKQTGREMKFSPKTKLYDVETGEQITPTGSSHRKRVEKMNQEFRKLTPFQQEVRRAIHANHEYYENLGRDRVQGQYEQNFEKVYEDAEFIMEYEIIIERWYEFIEYLHPRIRDLVRYRTDEILENASIEDKVAFALARKKNPDIFPDAGDSRDEIINAKMDAVMAAMNWYKEQQEYKDIMSAMDIVEEEGNF